VRKTGILLRYDLRRIPKIILAALKMEMALPHIVRAAMGSKIKLHFQITSIPRKAPPDFRSLIW